MERENRVRGGRGGSISGGNIEGGEENQTNLWLGRDGGEQREEKAKIWTIDGMRSLKVSGSPWYFFFSLNRFLTVVAPPVATVITRYIRRFFPSVVCDRRKEIELRTESARMVCPRHIGAIVFPRFTRRMYRVRKIAFFKWLSYCYSLPVA